MSRILLSAFQCKPLLAKRGSVLPTTARSSIDLNLTNTEASLAEDGVTFGNQLVPWEAIEKVAEEERKVFAIDGTKPRALQIFSEDTGWMRSLVATETAPTVLVSGIPMHRIKDTDPISDTRSKIKALGIQKGCVLDTATGLGYTAIFASRTASEVVTVELDPAAIELARMNPWSSELFSRK